MSYRKEDNMGYASIYAQSQTSIVVSLLAFDVSLFGAHVLVICLSEFACLMQFPCLES